MIENRAGPLPGPVADELAALQARAYAPTGLRPWTATDIAATASNLTDRLLIARDADGAAQGFLLIRILAGEGEILSLAVDPRFQRKHVGSRLLDELDKYNGPVKVHRLILEVAENNRIAINFYQMLGFSEIGKRRDYYRIDGNRIDALVMERRYR